MMGKTNLARGNQAEQSLDCPVFQLVARLLPNNSRWHQSRWHESGIPENHLAMIYFR